MARSTRTADEYVASLRNGGERFYASWVLDWLRQGGPSVADSWREGTTSPPGYPAQWSEERAKRIAGEVYTRWQAEQGEAAEAATGRRYQIRRQLASDVAAGRRQEEARARLEAAVRYGRSRRRRGGGGLLRPRSRRDRRAGR